MKNAIHHGVRVVGVIILVGCCLMLSGCDELALKTFVSIRTQGGICVSIDTGSDSNPGTSAAPKKTIEAAIDYILANGLSEGVLVAEGDYLYNYSTGNPLTIVEGISLYGGYSSDFSTRDPDVYISKIIDASSSGGLTSDPNRAIHVPEGVTQVTVIDGFTIQGGGGTISAGIFCLRSSPTISNNRIDAGTGSAESYGIYCYQSGADPEISNNREIRGGDYGDTHAVYNTSGASPLIKGNYIHGGDGSNTHAIHNSTNCSATIAGNLIHGGNGSTRTYGIFTESSSPNIWNNTIFGGDADSSDSHGIVAYNAASPLIYNNTIDGGSGSNAYGIRYDNALLGPPTGACTPDIRNNIIYTSSGGYCVFEYNSTGEHASAAENNDFWDPDGSGTTYYAYRTNGGGLYHSTTIGTFNGLSWASGNVSDDPVFSDADGADNDITEIVDNDWHLTPDPPPSGSGSPWSVTTGGQDLSASFTQDKDGNDRTISWSMGAYELNPF